MRALIVDEGRDRASLVAARALAADGWGVGSASTGKSLASGSRSVDRWHRIAALEGDGSAFVESVAAALEEGGYDVVFPTWEDAVLALSSRRSELSATFPYAAHEVLLRTTDKAIVTGLAAAAEIEVPRTDVATPELLDAWRGPLVLKPSTHAGTAARFANAAAAAGAAAEFEAAGVTPLAQEVVAGDLMAFAAVADYAGRLVSVSQQRAEFIWPAQVGVTARGVTIPVDPELRRQVAGLIAELGWFGLFQMQFLVGGGRATLIDFNGRFYGSIALAQRAGAQHAATWGRLALGLPVAPTTAVPGVRYQWLTRDLRASLHSAHPVREVGRALVLAPRAAHSLWSPAEPALAPRFLAQQAGRQLRHRLNL